MPKNGVIISDELLSEVLGALNRVLAEEQCSPAGHFTPMPTAEVATIRRLVKSLDRRRWLAREYWAQRAKELPPEATKEAEPHADPS